MTTRVTVDDVKRQIQDSRYDKARDALIAARARETNPEARKALDFALDALEDAREVAGR